MNFRIKTSVVTSVLKARLFNIRTPLLVNWEITRSCNARCRYCTIWDAPPQELNTAQALSIIEELGILGTRMVHFTGGEPLLREDVGILLEQCHKKNILTSMNSNGSLVSRRIAELKTLDLLAISFDGPEEIHDAIRAKGSYQGALEALTVARQNGIKVRILTALSKHNLGAVDFILEKAREFNASVYFQPATELLLGSQARNPIAPESGPYRQAISLLIAKKRFSRFIANSVSGLRFLYSWPQMRRIHCLAQLISCRIENDGNVIVCYRNQEHSVSMQEKSLSVRDAFLRLPAIDCDNCCCAGTVEINCALSFQLDAILNMWMLA